MLRKLVLFWIVVTLLVLPSWAGAEQNAKGPKAFIEKPQYEFQPVAEGSEVTHTFVLRNQGDGPLTILKTEAG